MIPIEPEDSFDYRSLETRLICTVLSRQKADHSHFPVNIFDVTFHSDLAKVEINRI